MTDGGVVLLCESRIDSQEGNLYGGHFSDDAAKYARETLDYDSVGSIAIREDSHKGISRIMFNFALEFVGLAVTADRKEHDLAQFVADGYGFMSQAMFHATKAITAISDSMVLPHFGVSNPK